VSYSNSGSFSESHPYDKPHVYFDCIDDIFTATTAAAVTNCTAVALREKFAELVSFQQHQPSLLPHKILTSAPCSLTSACHFSGNHATFATF
jgi:hypothetical protein